MAEGEVLETNGLGGEKRRRSGECANGHTGSFTQNFAPTRQAETGSIMSHPKLLFS
jgi:hypothetical protein